MGRTPAGLPTLKKKKTTSLLHFQLFTAEGNVFVIYFLYLRQYSVVEPGCVLLLLWFFFLTCFALGLDEPF